MTLHSFILSDIKEGSDPESEKYLDKHDKWPWYTLKVGFELTDDLEAHLQDLGYVNLDKDGFIYDAPCDHRSELHRQIYGNNDSTKAEILAWFKKKGDHERDKE